MSRVYELWDTKTRNLVSTHPSEGEAFAFVRQYMSEHGPEYPTAWALLWDDDDADTSEQIADGQELVTRALGVEPSDTSRATHSIRRAG
jgi:hypothetical protein